MFERYVAWAGVTKPGATREITSAAAVRAARRGEKRLDTCDSYGPPGGVGGTGRRRFGTKEHAPGVRRFEE
jgi:hypothetical protein